MRVGVEVVVAMRVGVEVVVVVVAVRNVFRIVVRSVRTLAVDRIVEVRTVDGTVDGTVDEVGRLVVVDGTMQVKSGHLCS